VITTFEEAFAEAERSAAAAAKAASLIVSAAKQMQKAAQEGDIAKLRRTAERLSSVAETARQDVANAKTAWPFSEDEERAYLSSKYELELCDEADRSGLKMYSRDARLLAYPSVIRLLPNELAVRVDRKRLPALRPTHLVRFLLANQKKKSRYPVERFLEALYSTYKIIVSTSELGTPVKLARVYGALTLLPASAIEYSKSDFARDIFMIDQSGVDRTKSGARLSLPASTGAKGGGADLFTFVAPDGAVQTYYGIQFTEG
jgi:hypothetical protein